MPSQWEGPNFGPHSSEIWGPIVLKLKFKKLVRRTTPHAKYGKDRIKGVGGANTQFVTTLVLPFFVFFARCHGHTAGSIATREASARVFSAKEVPFGSLDDEN